MFVETENIEFKSQFTEEIYKEVIAFANTDGGILYVGIDNNGNAVGLTDVDKEYTRITNGIRDAIMPDVTMFVRFFIQENKVIRITVSEGTNKPYYLKAKGLRSNGVYVRQGTSSVSASPEQIRQMIKESDGDEFEANRSLNQELTFEAAKRFFDLYGVEFSTEKYRALGITQKNDGIYSNLALILSDQCMHTIKVAAFCDDDCTVFRDSKEFGGSVFKQFEDTINYLALCNRTSSVIDGVLRTDKRDYPEEAIREALLNAIVHRDYGYSGSIIINVTDKKMEFISLGGLLPGLSPDDIRTGISQPRNKNLAEVFHRLRLIESYGTGIRRIFSLYSAASEKPRIEVTTNTFKISLPNMNSDSDEEASKEHSVTSQMQKVLDYINANGHITDDEIGNLLDLKRTRTYTIAKQMRDLGLIEAVGRGENKVYLKK
ncbi:MAG: putative DNA binding domain-containing protein [Clostridia bacterium]|nr:putative DNA binding domain-containing protein [Clostridia bacterium]